MGSKLGSLDSGDSVEVPDYVQQMADKLLAGFAAYQGPQTTYLLEDFVALSLNRLDLISNYSGQPLSRVKTFDYPDWSTSDFSILLDILTEGNDTLGPLIDSARDYVAHS